VSAEHVAFARGHWLAVALLRLGAMTTETGSQVDYSGLYGVGVSTLSGLR
jgi:hypothetical protein